MTGWTIHTWLTLFLLTFTELFNTKTNFPFYFFLTDLLSIFNMFNFISITYKTILFILHYYNKNTIKIQYFNRIQVLITVVKEFWWILFPILSIMVGFGSFLCLYWLVLVFPRGGTGQHCSNTHYSLLLWTAWPPAFQSERSNRLTVNLLNQQVSQADRQIT